MNLNARIVKVIEYSGFSSSEFADEIEVQRSNISHITSGRNKPSLDFLIKIKDRFPLLQWEWLIKGDGEMLMNTEISENEPPSTSTSLPDLFSLIDDDNFGITEKEDRVSKHIPQELKISGDEAKQEKISDSQRLEIQKSDEQDQNNDNQINKVKRIVFFYENGKFESFEP